MADMKENDRNAAIWYAPDSFDASGRRLPVVGRTAAGEGFLRALATHGNLRRLFCYTASAQGLEEFRSQIARLCHKPPKSSCIEWRDFHKLSDPGCLYVPDPSLDVHVWNRRSLGDQRAYSVCGVTHTTAHQQTIDALSALLTSPTQSWDALICTSQVVRDTVERLLGDWSDYLEDRGAGRIPVRIQLPVIPLGIDTRQFEATPEAVQAGREFRRQIGAGEGDIVALYLGRLSVNIKANPYSMLDCLEKAARRTGKKVHLVMAGWFQDSANMEAFSEGVKALSPSVHAVMMDGRQENVRRFIWFAADLFLSLVDNVQETFGISPLEAMAAGLPVVVTDWDGYRETVVDGETGFRIPTAFPAPGAGAELAIRYGMGLDSYENYLAHTSAATVIEGGACVDVLVRLMEDGDLRHTLGENGRRHVRQNFDWETVIHRYQDLWEELAQRRRDEQESVPLKTGAPAHPIRQDPFRLFETYPSRLLNDRTRLRTGRQPALKDLQRSRSSALFSVAMPRLLAENKCQKILRIVGKREGLTVAELRELMGNVDHSRFLRTVAWLMKVGLIAMADEGGDGP